MKDQVGPAVPLRGEIAELVADDRPVDMNASPARTWAPAKERRYLLPRSKKLSPPGGGRPGTKPA